MAQVDISTPSAPADPPPRTSSTPRIVVVAALFLLVGFIAIQSQSLWAEWKSLRQEMELVQRTTVVGYQNIHPNPSYARRPDNWVHDEGNATLLWSGWRGGAHQWFRVNRGDLDTTLLSEPMGRDVVQAIDYPLVESDGGEIWGRIPNEAPVVGQKLAGIMVVYPLQVLRKVAVVNDTIQDRPFLLTFNPYQREQPGVDVYEPIVDGHRVTMGMTGYFHERRPILYDRGTESLWRRDEVGNLAAIAGRFKGRELPRIGILTPVSWSDWRGRYPNSRLVVGADRSKGMPEL